MLRYQDLKEGEIYYAKYITLYEDYDNILWCEDGFKPTKDNKNMCYDHTIEVTKKDGQLYHKIFPGQVSVEHGVIDEWGVEIHGPGIKRFMETKIRFANPLPRTNREYSVKDLPENESGWMLPWALIRTGEDEWKVRDNHTVRLEFGGNTRIFIKKINGVIHINKSCLTQREPYEIVDMNKAFVRGCHVGSGGGRNLIAFADRNQIEIGSEGSFLDAVIVEELLQD